ncbi:GNAT family N-acetyltransferase [bacterium]|nr:GNAT family N-acetyltransferase [bacterium]
MKIRLAQLSDKETLVNFQLALALESEGLKLDLATLNAGVEALFSDPSLGQYWVAEIEGEVRGCLLTVPEWSDWRNATVLWIHSVYVHKDARGKGVYKHLYANLKEMVQVDSSLAGLRLYVDKRNESAIKVYEKLEMNGEHYHLYEWLK